MNIIFSLRNALLTASLLSLLIGAASCQRSDQAANSTPEESSPSVESVPATPESALEDDAPQPSPDESPQPSPPEATPSNPPPESSTDSTPPSANPSAQTTPPVASQAALPNTLVKTWEPLSSVLYDFGPMTITPTEVRWDNGQTSAYEVVSASDAGYMLKLTSVPSFYDTPNPYLKLVPESDAQEVEVYFYDTEAAANQDTYIMLGTYFVE